MITEIGKTFMSNSIEYKITYIDEKKKRLSIEPNNLEESKKPLPKLKDVLTIEHERYIVTYINEGKNRVSLELI